MTRETKIGLLVGLGFIIAFGLILGDRTQLQPGVADDLDLASPQSPQESMLSARGQGQPEQITPPVLQDVRQPMRPRGSGPLTQPGYTPQRPMPPMIPAQQLQAEPPRQQMDSSRSQPERPQQQYGAPQAQGPQQQEVSAEMPSPTPSPQRPAQIHVVRAGDNLRKIAEQYYGDRGQYTRIFDANRDQLNDPGTIRVGQRLRIPQANAPGVTVVDEQGAGQYLTDLARRQQSSAPVRTYTVQSGDTLWRIAQRQMHDTSPAAVNRLFEANRDQLRSPDAIVVGMTLKLPQ